jgi:hypothetical protein
VEPILIVLISVLPAVFPSLVQPIGGSRGWTGRRILKVSLVAAWLWWSVWLAIGSRQEPIGFLFVGALLGAMTLVVYLVSAWAWRGQLDGYDRYIERRYSR